MSAFRPVVVLLVIGGLTLLTLQNLAVTLPLTFLGIQTLALPLGIWVIVSLGAGLLTSLLLAGLLRFAVYLNAPLLASGVRGGSSRPSATRQSPRTPRPPETTKTRLQVDVPPPEPTMTTPSPSPVAKKWTDDWESPPSRAGEWEEPTETRSPSPPPPPSAPPQPTSPETTYSYKAQDRDRTGVGKTEDVYDANFRVIVPPPSNQPPPNQSEDDWEGGEDEDWV